MKVAEIMARHENDRAIMNMRIEHGDISPDVCIHYDRAYLLDLVARMRACLSELAGAPAEHNDARIGYVTMQVDRGSLGEARALLEESK